MFRYESSILKKNLEEYIKHPDNKDDYKKVVARLLKVHQVSDLSLI